MRVLALGLLGIAACYAPAPVEGLACSPSGACPVGQTCVDDVCVIGPDGGAPADAPVRNLLAFVSQRQLPGDFGGRAMADAACVAEAGAAGLRGEFIALLGTSSSAGASRLAGASGWVNLRGDRLVDAPDEWETGELRNPVRYQADGTDPGDVAFWRGGDPDLTCSDWSSQVGNGAANFNRDGLAVNFTRACGQALRVLCVEVGRRTPLPPAPAPPSDAKRVFVTSTTWTPGGGRADADAACVAAASDAGLAQADTFLAAIGVGAGSPFARFASPAPLVRVDDEVVAASGAALFTGVGELRSFVNRDERGNLPAAAFIWLGAPGFTCTDWTSADAGATAPLGLPDSADRGTLLGVGYAATCDDATISLLCIEP